MTDAQLEQLLIKFAETHVVQKQSVFERHAQTVIVGIVMLIVGWVGLSILDLNKAQNELITEQKLSNLKLENLTKTLQLQNETYVKQLEYIPWHHGIERRLQQLEERYDGPN